MRAAIIAPTVLVIAVALRPIAAAAPGSAPRARAAPSVAQQADDARDADDGGHAPYAGDRRAGPGDDGHARDPSDRRAGPGDDGRARDPSDRRAGPGDDGRARGPSDRRAGPGDDGRARDPSARGSRRAARPLISAVLSAAYAAAGLDRDPGRGWVQRTRLAGLIPWLTVRTTRDTSWQDAHAEVGHGTTLEFRATWRLDRLLFDGRELQVATIEAARRRERTRLASHVIRAYYAWRRAAAGTLPSGDDRVIAGRDDPARVVDDAGHVIDERATTRLDESIAELDALTDGWFSDQLARLQP